MSLSHFSGRKSEFSCFRSAFGEVVQPHLLSPFLKVRSFPLSSRFRIFVSSYLHIAFKPIVVFIRTISYGS